PLGRSRGSGRGQSPVPGGQVALEEFEEVPCLRGKALQFQVLLGRFERAERDVHSRNAFEYLLLQECLQEATLAASQFENTASPGVLERGKDDTYPLLGKTHRS